VLAGQPVEISDVRPSRPSHWQGCQHPGVFRLRFVAFAFAFRFVSFRVVIVVVVVNIDVIFYLFKKCAATAIIYRFACLIKKKKNVCG
jgi:hypothetical protein